MSEITAATTTAEIVPATTRGAIRAVMAPEALAASVEDYRQIQATLDRSNPEYIVDIRGKAHRTKGYWNSVALAFGLSVELASEERIGHECDKCGKDWGFLVVYRATAPNGAARTGDGACMASEKDPGSRSLHNVRAHAMTRAACRAVSNLVGFGEISASEINETGGYE